jgi:uncharacterized membrane protein YfcA
VEWLFVFVIVLLAVLTQSVAGFGLALVSMPILTAVVGLRTAAPLVALFALVAELLLLIAFRRALNVRVVWQLTAASVVGIPLGIVALRQLSEELLLTVLGVVLATYALYGLAGLRLPAAGQPAWAYAAGFVAGAFGGAYNTSGPPVILYGHARRWPPAEFKGNLQGFFLVNSIIVVAVHLAAGNVTAEVWRLATAAVPAVLGGVALGLRVGPTLAPAAFGRLVLGLLLVLGLWLIVR